MIPARPFFRGRGWDEVNFVNFGRYLFLSLGGFSNWWQTQYYYLYYYFLFSSILHQDLLGADGDDGDDGELQLIRLQNLLNLLSPPYVD